MLGLLHSAETGYERATIQRIAEAAGLGAGLVQHHFGSKLEILLALGERLAGLIAGRQRAAKSPRSRVDVWIDVHLAQGKDASAEAVRVGWRSAPKRSFIRRCGRSTARCSNHDAWT